MAKKKTNRKKIVESLTHEEARRMNIPTAEFQAVMRKEEQAPVQVAYDRRNRDLDPQLVWKGKDELDWSDLVVSAPPLYIQEKIHPKVLIDDLLKRTEKDEKQSVPQQLDLFADFNGLSDSNAKTEFYQHDANWTNRMILGDSLQVMASLAEREGLRGQVQCIYIDPPYGIKFNSNFQWSTTSRDVKDGKADHITREPEQVKAFRDTWRDGIHSYLTYLRDRLTVARDLLSDSGSVFVQISDENSHIVRSLLDEVFGDINHVASILFQTTTGQASDILPRSGDYVLWYAKKKESLKHRQLYKNKDLSELRSYSNAKSIINGETRKLTKEENTGIEAISDGWKVYSAQNLRSQDSGSEENRKIKIYGRTFDCGPNHHWKTNPIPGMERLIKADRIQINGNTPNYIRFVDDYPVIGFTNKWDDTAIAGFSGDKKRYVVETPAKVIQRCLLLSTDPGDLVIDPTCGSGTTAYVAEQWGRRWITIDTSRVSLALARIRIMGARYPYYILADSSEGQEKEAEIMQTIPSPVSTNNNLHQGFVYKRVPHIMLKSIANNSEIDVIWENCQKQLEPLRKQLNKEMKQEWEEWEIPRETENKWSTKAKDLHSQWWKLRITRQKDIDASIADKTDFEYLYDKPYEDKNKVRVAGPFTAESLSPHRVLSVNEDGDLIDQATSKRSVDETNFVKHILENLKISGVQQSHKEDKVAFNSISPWPGKLICAEGRYFEGDENSSNEKRAGIFIGPEFGTVARADLVVAAREAGDADFDILISCAFNYEAHASEFNKLGRIPILKAHMNADLHMAEDLKNTGKGNLFVIFGEPDIDIIDTDDDQVQIKINGVDIFHPSTGEVRSDGAAGIACWFIDTDYNEESFFVRHAYFLGANDPYKALKTTLKAEINQDAWDTLNSDISRPFDKPQSGRIAIKVINHLGDEVMKVFQVGENT
jgi:adenine-specific DNA-methyltransferase